VVDFNFKIKFSVYFYHVFLFKKVSNGVSRGMKAGREESDPFISFLQDIFHLTNGKFA